MKTETMQMIDSFLKSKAIAVAGYSTADMSPANGIYEKFKNNGFNVYAVNPKAEQIKKLTCFKSLSDIPEKPDAVMICTHPDATMKVLNECKNLGITKAWIHRSFGMGSFHKDAVQFCKDNAIELIPAGCPMMFIKPDIGHRIIKTIAAWQGKI